ncbi:MAG: GNAT family N-acetyltransferase [Lewinellaceae bacterium]|nr:GNAT family N-acetyltransferase [Lewinellaceae bacterium]
MNFSIFYQQPDATFWERYTRLWQNSQHRSPFQSPHILQYYAHRNVGNVAVFQCERGGELLGAALFKREKDHYSFLSDLKTDANFFMLHRDCTPEETRCYFEKLLETVRKENWALMLNHKPAWAGYMDEFETAIKSSPMYTMTLNYSVCPIAEADRPEELFKEVSASRNTRYKLNKFVKQENGHFEVLTDDSDMDQWAEDFCRAHILRWAPTPTPSAYRDPARREFLKNCLCAWQADGVLVRFALRTDNGRIGLMAGLREEDTLIYHTPTFHPDYSHVSPGRVLIYYITQWMAERGLRRLDFGDGNEPYKYYVASKDQVLRRVFISRKSNLPFIVKTRFIKTIREIPGIYQMYQNKLKPLYRNLKWKVSTFFSSAFCFKCADAFFTDAQLVLALAG